MARGVAEGRTCGSVLAAYNSSKLQREYLSTSGTGFQPEIGAIPVLTSTMAIVGTGIDICEVARIREAIERFGERFLKRVFTGAEREYCESKRNRIERYAARFAAKEAAMKAIGTGLRRGVSWQDFEIARETGGRPTLIIRGKAAEFAARLGMKRAALSISHTREQAMAQVILES